MSCLVAVALDEILREPSSVQAWAARQTLKLSFQSTLVKANKAPGLATCVERSLYTQETCANTLRPITSAFPLGSSSAGHVPRPSRPDTVLQRTCLRTTEMQINIEWTNWLHCFFRTTNCREHRNMGQSCVFQGHTTTFWRSACEPKCQGMKWQGHMTALFVENRAWTFLLPAFIWSPSTILTTTDTIVKFVQNFAKPKMPWPVTRSNVDALSVNKFI